MKGLLLAADPTWTDYAQVAAPVAAVLIAVAVPLTAFWRRPALSISEKEAKRHSQVEAGGVPHVRLLVENKRGRREAHRTRVLVEGYRAQTAGADDWTSLAYPSLGWPSAVDATSGDVTVYSGTGRPVGLGMFVRARRTTEGVLIRVPGSRQVATYAADDPEGASWNLCLALHNLDILNDRDKLPPGEWVIRLLVGADDGGASRHDVHIAWSGAADDEKAVLAEALDRLEVLSA